MASRERKQARTAEKPHKRDSSARKSVTSLFSRTWSLGPSEFSDLIKSRQSIQGKLADHLANKFEVPIPAVRAAGDGNVVIGTSDASSIKNEMDEFKAETVQTDGDIPAEIYTKTEKKMSEN